MTHLATKRSLKLSWVYAMAVGSAVGWGAFVLPYQWLSSSGLLAVLVGFVIATVLMGVIAINYGYATKSLPITGAGVVFAISSLGYGHGFIAGWFLVLGYSAIVALNASAVALVLRLLFPEYMQQAALYQGADWVIYAPEVAVSSVFLVGFAYLNVKNTALSGKVQFVAVLLMVLAVVVILIATSVDFLFRLPAIALLPPDGVSFWAACMSIVAVAPWAYIGFDSIPQMAGEFNFSSKKIMVLLLASCVSASLLYMAMVCASAFAFASTTSDLHKTTWATGVAISGVMGKFGLAMLVVAVGMGVFTGLNGFYMASSRVLLAMSQHQMLPKIFAKHHPSYHTPHVAIYTIMAICLISPWFGRAALMWIVQVASVGIAVNFFYACFCTYRLGKTGQLLNIVIQSPNRLQSVIGMFGCVIALGFLGLLIVPLSPAVLDAPSWIILAIWSMVGLGVYGITKRVANPKINLQRLHTFILSVKD